MAFVLSGLNLVLLICLIVLIVLILFSLRKIPTTGCHGSKRLPRSWFFLPFTR